MKKYTFLFIPYVLKGLERCLREHRLPSFLAYDQIYRRFGAVELGRRGYLNFLRHRPPNSIRPDCADLWFLYRLVRKRRPRCVLEFGSGCSTVIMAYALRENGGGVLYSVDADPYWAQVTKETLPTELQGIATITYSPVSEVEMYGVLGWRHVQIPDVEPDCLYLDGPALTPERRVAVDPLDLEDQFQPGFVMVVDGRPENANFLKRYFRRSYQIMHRKRFANTLFELGDRTIPPVTARSGVAEAPRSQ